MEPFDARPNLSLNFLILPLPARSQLIVLLKQKLHALLVLNNTWMRFEEDYREKFLSLHFDETSYVDAVRSDRRFLLKHFVSVAKLRESLKLVIPAMQTYDRRISRLVARAIYDCLVFSNSVFPQALVQMDSVIHEPNGTGDYF